MAVGRRNQRRRRCTFAVRPFMCENGDKNKRQENNINQQRSWDFLERILTRFQNFSVWVDGKFINCSNRSIVVVGTAALPGSKFSNFTETITRHRRRHIRMRGRQIFLSLDL